MKRDFETAFVTQCAPVLAGLKPANLFRWVETNAALMRETVEKWQQALRPRGVEILILKSCPLTAAFLVYVYRKSRLAALLENADVRAYLDRSGYAAASGCHGYLRQLANRLCCEEDFPHEIGVFLGYPLEDVIGFTANKGKNYTFCGYWKSYGDPAAAKATFESFRRCTEIYLRCYRSGIPITRLAIVA